MTARTPSAVPLPVVLLAPATVGVARWVNPARWPWWVRVLAVCVLARAFSAVVLVVVARSQAANTWTSAAPSYLQYVGNMWDGMWYRVIATQGYPAHLPIGIDGSVRQNAWAFYPLFPMLVRGLMAATGASWHVVAPLLALVLGAAAMVVVYRVVQVGAPRAVAVRPGLPLATVVLVSFFPSAPVFQVAYTESLALLLITSGLLLVIRRRYWLAVLVVVALGLTRAVALPMAVVVLVHAASRWRAARRGEDRIDRRDVVGLGALLVAAGVSGVAWPLVCAAVTGRADAYLLTQAAWRARGDLLPVMPWWDIAIWRFGTWGPLLLVVVLVVFVLLLTCSSARRLGPELLAWPAAYLAYLVAVIEPGTSLVRFLLLAFPLGAVTAGMVPAPVARRRFWLAAVVVVMASFQVGWLWWLWRIVPPSGWPP